MGGPRGVHCAREGARRPHDAASSELHFSASGPRGATCRARRRVPRCHALGRGPQTPACLLILPPPPGRVPRRPRLLVACLALNAPSKARRPCASALRLHRRSPRACRRRRFWPRHASPLLELFLPRGRPRWATRQSGRTGRPSRLPGSLDRGWGPASNPAACAPSAFPARRAPALPARPGSRRT